jgi:Homodimerisation domain of SGTA
MAARERLVVSILEFLEASIADGTVSAEDREGVEVAGMYSASHKSERGLLTGLAGTEQCNA